MHSSISSVTLAVTTDSQLIGNLIQGTGIDVQGTTRATMQRNTIVSTADGIRLRNTTSNNHYHSPKSHRSRPPALPSLLRRTERSSRTILMARRVVSTSKLFTGLIELNNIHDAAVGVIYGAAASLSRNQIHNNSTGVEANVATMADGFGFVLRRRSELVPTKSMPTRSAFNSPGRFSGSIFSIIRRASPAPEHSRRSISIMPMSLRITVSASISWG